MTHPHQPQTDSSFVAHCYRHPGRETNVTCTRCERPICPACLREAPVGFQCPECVRGRRVVRQPQLPYGGRISEHAALVTVVLGALNIVMFAVTAATSPTGFTHNWSSRLFGRLVLNPTVIADKDEYGRLIGAAFLHYGPWHILVNMFSLAVLGPGIERIFGHWRYLVLYLASALGASVVAFAFEPSGATVAGASGAIFGLFGALVVIYRKLGLDLRALVPTILINVYITYAVPNISWTAHLGGFVTGALVAAAIIYAPQTNRSLYQVGGVVGVVAVLAGLTIWRGMSLGGI